MRRMRWSLPFPTVIGVGCARRTHRSLQELRDDFEKAYADTTKSQWERCSASVGMAEYSTDDKTVELVFKRADKYMYKTKFKERNGF